MNVTEDYQDVLQNIEFAVMQVYNEHEELTDHNVDKALNGLAREYKAEFKGKNPPTLRLTELEQKLFDMVKAICEWRLGREKLLNDDDEEVEIGTEPLPVEVIAACLKRIRRSVSMWTKERGKRGYLDYVRQFIG